MERHFKQIITYSDVPKESKSDSTYPWLPTFPRDSYGDDLYELTNTAIEHYNSNHQNDQFEMVDPLCYTAFTSGPYRCRHDRHLNFIARRKKSSELKLFFAEIECPKRVEICTTVEPGNPLFPIGCGVCHPDGAMYHYFIKRGWGSIAGNHSGVVYSGGSRCLSTDEAAAKKFLSEAYTIKSMVEDLDAEDAYKLKIEINGHAMMALDKFNSENGAGFNFLEVVSCTRFVCEAVSYAGVFWAHLMFVAEIEKLSEIFFAEVCFDVGLVTSCVVVETTDCGTCVIFPDSGNESRCAVCPNNFAMRHPLGGQLGGYVAGYDGGTFADSLYNGRFQAVKSVLEQKDDEASHAARHEFYKFLES